MVDPRRLGASAVALLVLSGTAGAQGDAVRGLRRAFAADGQPTDVEGVRLAAIAAAATADAAETVDALCAAYLRCDGELRPLERDVSKRMATGGAKLAMQQRPQLDSLLRVTTAIERTLAAFSAPASLEQIVVRCVEGRELPPQLRAAVCRRAALLGPRAVPRLGTAVRDAKRPDDAWIALAALGACGRPAHVAGAEVEARLADRTPLVRLRAVRTLVEIDHRAGVPALVARLDAEQGRAHRLVVEALEELTGMALGDSAERWRIWWQAEGETFVRVGRAAAAQPARPVDAAQRTETATFFGLPQDGAAILYVLDRSNSMKTPVAGRRAAGAAAAESRWERLLAETDAALDRLRPDQTFNIVAFGDENMIWCDTMQRATPERVAAAKAWLHEAPFQLGTNVFGALDEAFALGGPNLQDRYFDAAVDTMLFLSDGHPTRRDPATPRSLGRDDPELCLALARRRNPFGSVTIHAVALGRGALVAFVRELASEHGGQFRHEQ
ncbi:MAG: VWA domain-containing protein [Planctomycetes bacterium]|nr:VWA domain-containing protein [Planctomycetota bacterium]